MGTLLIILGLITLSGGIYLPDKVFVSPKFGISAEPEALVFHFDNNVYFTVGVDLGIVPNNKQLIENYTVCNIVKNQKTELHQTISDQIEEFVKTIPEHFSPLMNHFCRDDHIDCYFERSKSQHRGKRQVILTMAAVAGVASAGVGLYNLFNDHILDDHIRYIDEKTNTIESTLKQSREDELEYNEITNSIFLKTHYGLRQMSALIKADLCTLDQKLGITTAYMIYSLILANLKKDFNNAMDGHVTDFLVSDHFLRETILKKDELKDSIYQIDPGMFYSTSTSLLYKIEPKKKLAYFLITTPILLAKDVSPVYQIHNLGWMVDSIHYRLRIPDKFYYYTELNETYIMSSDFSSCRQNHGYYICPHSNSIHGKHEQCLEQVITYNSDTDCVHLANKGEITCEIKAGKSGLSLRSCKNIFSVKAVRQHYRKTTIPQSNNSFLFIPYQDFNIIEVDGKQYQSRTTGFKTISIFQEDDLTSPISFDLEKTVLTDSDEDVKILQQKTKEIRENLKYQITTSLGSSQILVGFVVVLAFSGLLVLAGGWYFLVKKRTKTEKEKRENLLTLLKLRREGIEF